MSFQMYSFTKKKACYLLNKFPNYRCLFEFINKNVVLVKVECYAWVIKHYITKIVEIMESFVTLFML